MTTASPSHPHIRRLHSATELLVALNNDHAVELSALTLTEFDELIRESKRAVLVTRFWYTRWVHQLRTIVTGMTRDGTFAIEDGEIAYPVKNFRFTQSYHEALAGTLGIGSDLALLVPGEQFGLQLSSYRVPALRLAAFAFTGATQY